MRRLLTPILPPSLAAAALLVAPAFAAADDPVPAAKRLPPVTYGFVSVPDVTEAKARFDGTAAAGVFTDPALAEVRDMIAEKVGEAGEELRNRLGVTLEDLAKVPTGEVTFAVVQTAPRKVAVVGLLDYGKSRDTVDALLEKAEDALDENELTRSEEPFEGTEIVVWTAPAPEVDEFAEDYDPNATRPEPQRFGYFLKDSYLVVASDPTALEAVLVRWDGTHSSTFADSETFSYIADRTQSDDRQPVLLWYADIIGSVRSAVLGSGSGGLPVQMALSYLGVLGIDEFKAIGGSMDWATEEYASVGKVVLYADRTDRALGVFTFPPAPTAPPAWVSADAASYAAFNWDLAGAYDAVRAIYDSMIGPGEFDRYVAEQSDKRELPVDVKADVIDAFSGKIELVSYPIAPEVLAESVESGEQPPQPVVIALGLRDPRKLSELVEKAAAESGGQLSSRDFRGTPIYEAANPSDGQRFGFAVSGDTLLLSPDVTRLESALRGPADAPLVQSDTFKEAVATMPPAVSILTFSDQTGQAETFYNMFRDGAFTGQAPADQGEAFKEVADALPPFDAVRKYLGLSAGYLVPDEHGVLWVSFGLEPEAE